MREYKTLILINATTSMDDVIHLLEISIPEIFERIKRVLRNHETDPYDVYFKIAIFRNYKYSLNEIYIESNWENSNQNLDYFIN